MQKWCGLLVIVYLVFAGSSKAQEASSDAPYLYYYSDYYDGIVVERADGTDRVVMGEGQLADERIGSGPGWSPSGRWLASTTGHMLPGGHIYNNNVDHTPWAINIDGKRLHVVLDDLDDAVMAWSPVEDLLFVIGAVSKNVWDEATEEDDLYVVFALVDPEKDEIIAYSEARPFVPDGIVLSDVYIPSSENGGTTFSIQWAADGQQVIGIYRDQSNPPFPTSFKVFGVDGSLIEKTTTEDIVSISSSGNIIYQPQNTQILSVDNLINGAVHEFQMPGERRGLHRAVWNSSGEYALVQTSEGLYLLAPDGNRFELIDSPNEPHQYFGLPEPEWSPDGEYALFQSDEGASYVVYPQSGIVSPSLEHGHWSGKNRVTSIASTEDRTCIITDHDVVGQTITAYVTSGCYYGMAMSTDRRYVAAIADGVLIEDLWTETSMMLRPHESDGPSSSAQGEIYWHSQANWMFTAEDPNVTGGSSARWMGIASADGLVRRDFSVGGGLQCVNWLPPQVNPDNLGLPSAPPLPLPQSVLHGSNRWFSLIWSPDGEQIAGFHWYYLDPDMVTVWDVINRRPNQVLEDAEGKQISWEDNESGGYMPVLVAGQTSRVDEADYVLATSPDGKQIILRDPGQVLDTTTREAVAPFILRSDFDWFASASYSSDGRLLAVADRSHGVSIWDTQTWERLVSLDARSMAVAFNPDGAKLAVASSWDIQIWDVAEVLAWGREIEGVD